MLRRVAHASLVLALVLCPCPAAFVGAAETARQILDRGRALDDGPRRWNDRTQLLDFDIRGRLGERRRSVRVYERRLSSREHKLLARIFDPADVRDVGFLEFAHADGSSEQWLYLPEYKRIRRVGGAVRNERFVGSDLSHGDIDLVTTLPGWDESDADATLNDDDVVDGLACHVIDLAPKRSGTFYRRIRLWLDKDALFARKLELFADGKTLTKRIVQSDVRPVGTIPVAYRTTIETLADGTSTIITVAETQFGVAPSDDCFSQATLEDPRRDAVACGAGPPK